MLVDVLEQRLERHQGGAWWEGLRYFLLALAIRCEIRDLLEQEAVLASFAGLGRPFRSSAAVPCVTAWTHSLDRSRWGKP